MQFEKNNHKMVYQHQWAVSVQGRPIELWTWQKNKNKPILLIGGVHGDEPEGVWLAQSLLNWLKTMELRKNLFQLKSFALITCLNPDGYFSNSRTNGNKVDLNRNFATHDWKSEFKEPRYFPGPKPASEPEVIALTKLIDMIEPQLMIHFHSWEPCVVYTGDTGRDWSIEFSRSSGYPLKEDIGYPTPGSLGHYGWKVKNTPVICLEEQEGCMRDHVWLRWKHPLIKLLKENQ